MSAIESIEYVPQALAILGAQDVDDGPQRSHQPGVVTVAHGLGDISKSGIRDLHVPDDPPQHVDGIDAADVDPGPVAILLGDQVGDELGYVGQVVRRRVLAQEVRDFVSDVPRQRRLLLGCGIGRLQCIDPLR